MGGGTTSSSSENRPLTGAERADIYKNSVGEILNTYTQSGLPYGGQGSMTTPARFSATPSTYGTVSNAAAGPANTQPGSLYQSSGNAGGDSNISGMKSLNPFGLADKPNMNMPTGASNPGGINFPLYQTPEYQTPGNYKTFDTNSPAYSNILKGYTDPLDAAKATDIRNANESAAKRGVWSSGLALQGENDINKAYAPQYSAAGGAATTSQLGQLAAENTYNQAATNAANAFNQQNAQNTFSSGWAPLNYLSSLWGGTAGNVGGTNTFGANVSI